jgi:hypothetical protein
MVVKTIGMVARVAGAVVDVVASAPGFEPRRWTRPQPLRLLRAASLDRRLAPYSAIGGSRPRL